MSEFRVEKRRVEAEVTLSTGATLLGSFFLANSSASHSGPERVGEMLNAGRGFFPFELASGENRSTVLLNRAHVTTIALPPDLKEAQLEPGYDVATRRRVAMLLWTGARVSGTVSVYRPIGRDRLSDYSHIEEVFRYLETSERTLIVNSAHIIELMEIAE